MDVYDLKNYIYENDRVDEILKDLGCHHIKKHQDYYTCGNPDGDNPSAITVYISQTLNVIDYTRKIKKSDDERQADIIDLVSHFKEINFPQTIKYISNLMGLDYYHNFNEDLPESLLLTKSLFSMRTENNDEDDDLSVRKIDSKILSYYYNFVNDLFYKDHISYETQQDFNIGYDEATNRITIPIYSEIGDLVGVKGRLFKEKLDEDDLKYIYLEPTPRRAILYGLNKTIPYINRKGYVYVFESEKAVMQAWSYGYQNCVATGGTSVSKRQVTMLSRLGAKIIFCFDKDFINDEENIDKLKSKFIEGIPLYFMRDNLNILKEKESPTDDPEKWKLLLKSNNLSEDGD